MSNETFYIKRNDTSPAIRITCQDGDGVAVDLTGASVRFHLEDDAGTVVVDAAASIVTAASGIVQYAWGAADTSTAGYFYAEFEVTYADNTVETFPNYGKIEVVISSDIA